MKKYVYVDYENINNLTSLVDIEGKYLFFIGATQRNIRTDLVLSTSDKAIEWIRISGNGKNALDFHIAYMLALNSKEKNVEHIILSKDTGFDPLLSTLKKKHIHARRVVNIKDINGKTESVSETPVIDKIQINLMKINKTKRPQSVKKLEAYIKALDKSFDSLKAHDAVEELFRRNFISSTAGSKIKYME